MCEELNEERGGRKTRGGWLEQRGGHVGGGEGCGGGSEVKGENK